MCAPITCDMFSNSMANVTFIGWYGSVVAWVWWLKLKRPRKLLAAEFENNQKIVEMGRERERRVTVDPARFSCNFQEEMSVSAAQDVAIQFERAAEHWPWCDLMTIHLLNANSVVFVWTSTCHCKCEGKKKRSAECSISTNQEQVHLSSKKTFYFNHTLYMQSAAPPMVLINEHSNITNTTSAVMLFSVCMLFFFSLFALGTFHISFRLVRVNQNLFVYTLITWSRARIDQCKE